MSTQKGFVQSIELSTFTINCWMWYGFMCVIWIANIKRVSFIFRASVSRQRKKRDSQIGVTFNYLKNIAHAKINRAWKQFLLINFATDNNFYCANEWFEFKFRSIAIEMCLEFQVRLFFVSHTGIFLTIVLWLSFVIWQTNLSSDHPNRNTLTIDHSQSKMIVSHWSYTKALIVNCLAWKWCNGRPVTRTSSRKSY